MFPLSDIQTFTWSPGCGIDAQALARLQRAFKRPRQLMGEAWFMGEERRMFTELSGDLSQLSCGELMQPLDELASGISSFGVMQEWGDWYHYLLGQLLPRCHERDVDHSLLEALINGFIAMYPAGVQSEPYPGFGADILNTLGRCMMQADCWDDDRLIVAPMLCRDNNNPAARWGWEDASGDLSASLFFCLRYLPPPALEKWWKSVLAISSPHWRAQLMAWFVGAHGALDGMLDWPADFSMTDQPSISWGWSHVLRESLAVQATGKSGPHPFVPALARDTTRRLVRSYFTDQVFIEWLDSIGSVPYLVEELAFIPNQFEMLYMSERA